MVELCQEVKRLKENFVSFEISHVPRVLFVSPLQYVVRQNLISASILFNFASSASIFAIHLWQIRVMS
jgi:hypothetical protein